MEKDGVWRTIRGRRVFIAKGESLGQAMSKSGKFKNLTRTKLRETKDQLRQEDRLNKSQKYWEKEQKATSKEKFNALRNKAERDYNKLRARDKDEIEYRGAEQAEKNRINEGLAKLHNESGKTRVEKNAFKYSEADRRELRHEELQKKLRDYKNKKGLEDNLDRRGYEQKINDDYALNFGDSSQNYEDTKAVPFKQKEKAVMQQRIADYKAKKQSNNKIDNENKTFSSIEFEKNLPHEMRWKETYSVNDGKDLYWVTQEPFTNEMLNKYAEEFKKQGRYEKAYITTRDFSGYDYNDDLKRDTMAVIDKKGNINDNGYEKQMNKAGWEYQKQSNNKAEKDNYNYEYKDGMLSIKDKKTGEVLDSWGLSKENYNENPSYWKDVAKSEYKEEMYWLTKDAEKEFADNADFNTNVLHKQKGMSYKDISNMDQKEYDKQFNEYKKAKQKDTNEKVMTRKEYEEEMKNDPNYNNYITSGPNENVSYESYIRGEVDAGNLTDKEAEKILSSSNKNIKTNRIAKSSPMNEYSDTKGDGLTDEQRAYWDKADNKFKYMMLSRMQSDVDYYLGNGNRNANDLWGKEEENHINNMKYLYNSLKEKPEWLTEKQLKKYEKELTSNKKANTIKSYKAKKKSNHK